MSVLISDAVRSEVLLAGFCEYGYTVAADAPMPDICDCLNVSEYTAFSAVHPENSGELYCCSEGGRTAYVIDVQFTKIRVPAYASLSVRYASVSAVHPSNECWSSFVSPDGNTNVLSAVHPAYAYFPMIEQESGTRTAVRAVSYLNAAAPI